MKLRFTNTTSINRKCTVCRWFTLHSTDLSGQLSKTQEAASFGCDGSNISPALSWSNVPSGTKACITVYDPDAPTGSGWWHWVVFNIPASVQGVPADFGNVSKTSAVSAIQSMTDYGKAGFGVHVLQKEIKHIVMFLRFML